MDDYSNIDSTNYNTWDNSIPQYVELIDVSTKEQIPIPTIMDSIRLSRAGESPIDDSSNKNSVVHSRYLSKSLLGQFLLEKDVIHPEDAVSCLGIYITNYMHHRITELGDKNRSLDVIENKEILDDMTFRNYLKGGAAPKDFNSDKSESITEDGSLDRISEDLGIGLGESTVLNPPFQFNKRDDPRTNPVFTKIGRVYSTQIMNNWPVVLIQPGRLKYNTGFFKLLGLGGGAGVTEALIRTGGEGITGAFSKMFSVASDALSVVGTVGSAIFGTNKVVEFRQSYNLFKQYTRFLYENLATMMGLISGGKYVGSVDNLNFDKFLPTKNLTGGSLNAQFIPFRCGKGVTTNESFSNSTETNPLMESMNSTAQENDANSGDAVSKSAKSSGGDPVSFLAGLGKKVGMSALGAFSEQALILSGKGRATLPDVFSSSSFSRSFNFQFKFHSPFGDEMSIFENEYLQYLTMVGFTAARQTGKLSYTSPFNIRINVKNRIMINCGIVESLSVTRGGDINDWTPSGHPKTLTVDLGIKDMEPNITLPMASRGPLRMALEVMFPSTGMSEYLASLGGLSLSDMKLFSKKKIARTGQIWLSSWNAKLNRDNLISTVTNSRLVSNVMSAFVSTDLDNYNRMGDLKVSSMNSNTDNMVKGMFGAPGFYAHSVAINGGSGTSLINSEKAADSDAMNEINNAMNDSFYGGFDKIK